MYDTVITLRHYTLRHYAAHNSTSNSGFRSVRLRPKGKALIMTKAKPSPDGALRNREPRSRGDHDRGTERNGEKVFAYLSGGAGCVTTAGWWCQKQPPIPIAAEMMIAQASRTRMSAPKVKSL